MVIFSVFVGLLIIFLFLDYLILGMGRSVTFVGMLIGFFVLILIVFFRIVRRNLIVGGIERRSKEGKSFKDVFLSYYRVY